MTDTQLTRTYAQNLDREDGLGHFRNRFFVTDPRLIYLDGNSLGRLPKATAALLRDGVERQWGERLIRGWNEGWMELGGRIGAKLARLLGAQPHEVLVADSTSVNLYKLALAALNARPTRRKIVTDNLNFPSDLYVLQGICAQATPARELHVVPSADGIRGPVDELLAAIDEETALVTLTHAVFKSAYVYDMAAISARAHEVGALVLWDLSHAAGSVPIDLTGAGADLAVGCTYKYLNGGPGAPASTCAKSCTMCCRIPCRGGWARPTCLILDSTTARRPACSAS
jgi:kynureninase